MITMNQNLTIEQMEALLKEPAKPSRIQMLEGVVKARTPQYISLSNPQFDEKLLKAHYLLARLYAREGDLTQAQAHFKDAENEFFNMCQVRTQQPKYISGGLEGFRKVREQERQTEKELEGYRSRLFGVADKMGYDATSLLLAPTSANPKSNLVEKIMDYAV